MCSKYNELTKPWTIRHTVRTPEELEVAGCRVVGVGWALVSQLTRRFRLCALVVTPSHTHTNDAQCYICTLIVTVCLYHMFSN